MHFTDKQKGMGLAFLGVLMLTPDSLLVRIINLGSWELIFYRGLVPFVVLFLSMLIYYKKNFLNVCTAIGIAGVFNAILIALANITFVLSLKNTNVANTLIMVSLAPFMAAIFSSFFLNERPNFRTWVVIVLCFFIVIFIFFDSYEGGRIIGDILGIITAALVGGSAVVIRSKKNINFIPSLLLAKIFIILITISFVQNFYIGKSDIILVLILGIFIVLIPFIFFTIAPRYIPAHEVELFFVLETVLGPIWVWLVINEEPTIKAIIGGVSIILLILLNTIVELKFIKK